MWLGCFWREQECAQAPTGANKCVVRLLPAKQRCSQSASDENKGVVRLLLAKTRMQ